MNEINEFLLPLFVEALALRADPAEIDRLYSADPLHFREIARNHKHYNVYLFDQGTLDKAIYCRKVLGLLLAGVDLDPLIRASWPKVMRYVKSHKGRLDIADLMNTTTTRADDLSTFNSTLMVGLYLANIYADEVIVPDELKEEIASTIRHHILRDRGDDPTKSAWENIDPETKGRAEGLLQRIERKYNVSCSSLRALEDELLPNDHLSNCAADSEGIIVTELDCSAPITRQDYLEVLAIFAEGIRNDIIPLTETAEYMQYAMKIRTLARAYMELKKRYFDSSYDLLEAQICVLETDNFIFEQQMKAQEEAALRQKAALESEISRLREDYKTTLERQIAELQRENQRLQDTLDHEASKSQELHALREYFFQQQQEPLEETLEDAPIVLPAVKCVIVGGHPGWQSRLKEKVPDTFVFISVDSRSFDPQILKGAAAVIVNATYCSHALYYRVVENIDDGSKLNYVSTTNINVTLKTLEAALV